MWKGMRGPCTCYYCSSKPPRQHPERHSDPKWGEWGKGGHLQVAESLDPKDIVRTKICPLCAHEEEV